MERFISAEPFPPGEYIQEEMEARGWGQEDLAQVLGISRRQIANLLSGASALTPDVAVALGQAFKQDPVTWMNLQVTYELALAANKERDTARRTAIFNKVPIRELKKRCWLPNVDDIDELESSVCKLLRITSIDQEPQLAIAAQKYQLWIRELCSGSLVYASKGPRRKGASFVVPRKQPRTWTRGATETIKGTGGRSTHPTFSRRNGNPTGIASALSKNKGRGCCVLAR